MGQSVSLATLSAGSAGINVKELEDLTYEKSLGTARFMKCIRARHRHGLVVVKVAMRPFPEFKLGKYVKAIRLERDLLVDVPNALGYQRVFETETSGYLVRQYLYSSLYDRMSTRPFLEDIEKRWLAFQLLCVLRDCHARNVYHGDIKTENILVTSWNWLYLTDFSSCFKKTYLPEDNPADFSYFFDTSGRRTCYVAPERFLSAGEEEDSRGVTWAMDVFSVGCVIAELFLESPIFSLSQLFKYRKGDYDPAVGVLGKIEDKEIRELIAHMIQIEPESRYSAEEYLNFWRRKAFPEYFYSFLHQYMGLITDPSSGRAPVLPDTANFGEADDRIDRVYYDFDKISYFLGYDTEKAAQGAPNPSGNLSEVIPVEIDIPNNRHSATSAGRRPVDDGTLIFLTLVVSALRNTARPTARLRACDLMLAFAERISDEAKLDRVLPYVVTLLADRTDTVKMAAIRTITQLLSRITIVSPVNAYVFTEYIRPRLQPLVDTSKTSPTVRATYASCLAALAHTSLKILDMVQALKADGSIPTADPEAEDGFATAAAYRNLYDVARSDLVEHFEVHTKALLTDSDASVRRAFLGSVSSLCVFFGSPKANDVILSHLNTYLNDKDWMLKCAFFQTIVGVATFVGGSSLEDFILPLMVQALTDPEEFVVEKVLSSFASMAELGLFQRSKNWEMVDVVARFMIHPNLWIREAATHFVSAATRFLSISDTRCIILPIIRPYLKHPTTTLEETSLLDSLKPSLPRAVFEMTATWALKVEQGVFWKPLQQQHTFSFGSPDQAIPIISSKDLGPNTLRKAQKNDEDEQWLTRLRNLGMSSDDEFKLMALRDYIGRMAARRPKNGTSSPSRLNNIVNLKELNVTPQIIFFESKKSAVKPRRYSQDKRSDSSQKAPSTIADALLDASTTIGIPADGRKKRHNDPIAVRLIPESSANANGSPFDTPSLDPSSPKRRLSPRYPALHAIHTARNSSRTHAQVGSTDEANTDGSLTPTDSLKTRGRWGQLDGVKHKRSAISLLNKQDTPKTVAEISTDPTNATGKMDGAFTNEPSGGAPSAANDRTEGDDSPMPVGNIGHTYDGKDPNVMRLLDNLASENHPSSMADFGPTVVPTRQIFSKKTDSHEANVPWRPQGIHVATFGEHTAAINRVLPSPDHLFFITASDDGSVKVWDTFRLEKNLIHRSRQTYKHAKGAKVQCVTFVERTHTFVSCATDGSVHVVRVDCSLVGDTTKYGKIQLVREHQLRKQEYAVWCEQFKADTRPILILATNTSRIIALDLRTMKALYTFSNPVHHGVPTCFCVDRKHNWLLLGTTHGVLDLWDLRFCIRIKSWGLIGGTPIRRIQLHPLKDRGRWVCVIGGTGQTDITVWDIEKAQCREVYRVNTVGASGNNAGRENLKPYEGWHVDEENPEGMLGRFAASLNPALTSDGHADYGIRALAVGVDAPEDGRGSKYGFFVTGGFDRKVRFWDLTRIETSAVISGLEVDEPQPRYITTHPTVSLAVHVERTPQSGPSAPNAGAGEGRTKSNSGARRVGIRPPRSTVISAQQRGLLRNHLDVVTDVALLERPVGMTVSVDRMGCVYVFQ